MNIPPGIVPFLAIGALVMAMGNGVGSPHAPIDKAQSSPKKELTAGDPNAYNNGLIGQMIYEMRYEGELSPQTQSHADSVLTQCQAIKFNHPTCQ